MIITIRELNAFGNALEQTGNKSFANEVHSEVLRMVERKVTEVDLKIDCPEDKKLYDLIKKAEEFLKLKQTHEKLN